MYLRGALVSSVFALAPRCRTATRRDSRGIFKVATLPAEGLLRCDTRLKNNQFSAGLSNCLRRDLCVFIVLNRNVGPPASHVFDDQGQTLRQIGPSLVQSQ